jgi:hypothetical protein
MNELVWAVIAVCGVALTAMAGRLGTEGFELRGRPYGFGTKRGFQIAYRAMGVVLIAASVGALVFRSNLNIAGLLFIAGGAETCLRSREIGMSFWRAARRYPELTNYYRGVVIAGAFAVVLGTIVLFRL